MDSDTQGNARFGTLRFAGVALWSSKSEPVGAIPASEHKEIMMEMQTFRQLVDLLAMYALFCAWLQIRGDRQLIREAIFRCDNALRMVNLARSLL